MASKTIKLDTFSKLKRWVEKHQGQGVTLDGILNWLEHDPHGIPLKSSVAHVLVRDLASKGTPEDLEELQARGYDLRAKCTHQVDGNALHSAAQHNKKANALALIAMGLDPGQRLYANGPSALDEALINGHLSLFEALRPHGPKTFSEQDREAFLSAALSRKTRQDSWGQDEQKDRTLDFVLRFFGPYTPTQLNQALAVSAQQGFEQCFDTLVRAGAQPQTPCALLNRDFHAHGNLLLELLSRVAPGRWEPILKRYGEHDEWFFPPPPVSEPPVEAADVAWLHERVSRHRPSVLHPGIREAIASIRAQWREKHLEGSLDEPRPRAPGRPRF